MGKMKIFALIFSLVLTGCASTGGANYSSTELKNRVQSIESKVLTKPLSPKHGDVIWSNLKVGMSIKEVLTALPDAKFDDQWSSGGIVGVMAEGGIVAAEKIKVVSAIEGPYKSPANLYCLFDTNGLLDGIVIMTVHKNLPPEVKQMYGAIGFYLPEYKEAAKILIRAAIPELGSRVGAPKFGKEKLDSIGSVGVVTANGAKSAVGFGFMVPSLSPASIVQMYSRDGYQSMLSIRSIHNGLYNVYAATTVMMYLRAKTLDDYEIPDIE